MTRRMRLPRTAAHPRLMRATAAVAIAVSTLGLSACQWTSPITTQMQYDPADGKSIEVGSVRMKNALIVASTAGGNGTLVGAIENLSKQPQTVQISIGETPVGTIQVPPGQVATLGAEEPVVIAKVPDAPGALTEIRLQAGGSAAAARIPVLPPQGPYAEMTATSKATPSPTIAPGSSTSTASPTTSATS